MHWIRWRASRVRSSARPAAEGRPGAAMPSAAADASLGGSQRRINCATASSGLVGLLDEEMEQGAARPSPGKVHAGFDLLATAVDRIADHRRRQAGHGIVGHVGDFEFEVARQRHRRGGVHGDRLMKQPAGLGFVVAHPAFGQAHTTFPRLCADGAGRFQRAAAFEILPAARTVPVHFHQGDAADALDALVRLRGVGLQDFQGKLVPADGKRKLGNLHGQVHVVRTIGEHDAEPGNFGVHFLPLVVSAEVGLEFLQAMDQRAELAVHPLQHRGQRGELAMDAVRHFQLGLVGHFMADVGPGVLQQRANLNLRLQSEDFRGNGDRDAGLLQLLRIDRDDVMHRAVAELGGTQSLADVLAVGAGRCRTPPR